MRLTNAPGSRSRRSCCEVSHRPVADGHSWRYGRGRSWRAPFKTALVLLPPVWGRDPTPRRKRSVSKNDHDHENPSSCWQRSLNGGHPPRLFSITVLGVTTGKTRNEHFAPGCRSTADLGGG